MTEKVKKYLDNEVVLAMQKLDRFKNLENPKPSHDAVKEAVERSQWCFVGQLRALMQFGFIDEGDWDYAFDKFMTSYTFNPFNGSYIFKVESYAERCRDCACLVAGDNGEWVCDECGKRCSEVEHCPEGMK